MKYIFIIITFTFTCTCYAQPPVLHEYSLSNIADALSITEKGAYSKDTSHERNQYVGTWEYNQGGILFQVKLEKVNKHLRQTSFNYYYVDIISIKYRLVKNGVELFNNINSTTFNSEGIKQSWDGYLNCTFIDEEKDIAVSVHINKIDNTPGAEKILFTLKGGYTLLGPEENYQSNDPLFSIPTQPIEMIKL